MRVLISAAAIKTGTLATDFTSEDFVRAPPL